MSQYPTPLNQRLASSCGQITALRKFMMLARIARSVTLVAPTLWWRACQMLVGMMRALVRRLKSAKAMAAG
jgi:hypothetical protein